MKIMQIAHSADNLQFYLCTRLCFMWCIAKNVEFRVHVIATVTKVQGRPDKTNKKLL